MLAKSPRKFSNYTDQLADEITQLYVGSIRKGIEEGFKSAVENTVQDSSNAAVHWMIGVQGKGSTHGRKFGQLGDFRGGRDPLVGERGDNRDSTSLAASVVGSIVEREVKTVLNTYVKGQRPELNFYFYNAVASNPKYDFNAMVTEAGKQGVKDAQAYFEREVKLGNTRRFRLKR